MKWRATCCVFILLFVLVVTGFGQTNCTTEKYEVTRHVTVDAYRCDGKLRVSVDETTRHVSSEGNPYLVTNFEFQGKSDSDWYGITVIRFENPETKIDPESILTKQGNAWLDTMLSTADDVHDASTKQLVKWRVDTDKRRDWAGDGSGTGFPSRIIKLMLPSYWASADGKNITQPEFWYMQFIYDTHNNVAYRVWGHYWMFSERDFEQWSTSMLVTWGK